MLESCEIIKAIILSPQIWFIAPCMFTPWWIAWEHKTQNCFTFESPRKLLVSFLITCWTQCLCKLYLDTRNRNLNHIEIQSSRRSTSDQNMFLASSVHTGSWFPIAMTEDASTRLIGASITDRSSTLPWSGMCPHNISPKAILHQTSNRWTGYQQWSSSVFGDLQHW